MFCVSLNTCFSSEEGDGNSRLFPWFQPGQQLWLCESSLFLPQIWVPNSVKHLKKQTRPPFSHTYQINFQSLLKNFIQNSWYLVERILKVTLNFWIIFDVLKSYKSDIAFGFKPLPVPPNSILYWLWYITINKTIGLIHICIRFLLASLLCFRIPSKTLHYIELGIFSFLLFK